MWKEQGNMLMLTNNLNAWLLNVLWSGNYERALRLAEESLALSRETKDIWNQGWPRHVRGQIWLDYGEADRGLDELEASVRLAEQANTPVYATWYRANLSTAYISVGEVQKGMDLYHATRLRIEEVPVSPGRTATLVGYALCEITAGQLEAAAVTLAACVATNSVWDYSLTLARCRLALARKDAAHALEIAEATAKSSRQLGLGQCLPEALLLAGQAHRMNAEDEPAKNAFQEARIAAENIGSRRLLWQILSALAQAEPEAEKSTVWREQACESIRFISDHMTRDGLRGRFLQLPEVRAVMGRNRSQEDVKIPGTCRGLVFIGPLGIPADISPRAWWKERC